MKVKSYSVATICASNRTVSPLTCLLSSNCAHIESKIFNANLSQLLEKKESNHSEAKGFECMLKPKCEYFLLLGYFCDDCSFSLLKHWLTFFTQPVNPALLAFLSNCIQCGSRPQRLLTFISLHHQSLEKRNIHYISCVIHILGVIKNMNLQLM